MAALPVLARSVPVRVGRPQQRRGPPSISSLLIAAAITSASEASLPNKAGWASSLIGVAIGRGARTARRSLSRPDSSVLAERRESKSKAA